MGRINKYNYYSVQDLVFAEPIIEKMLEKKRKIGTIFRFLRNEARWDAIGDYPLIFFICLATGKVGRHVTAKEISKVLRKTEEFKDIRQNNQLIAQICAELSSLNADSVKEKRETDESLDTSEEGKL